MIPYIVVFCLVIIFTYISDKELKKNKKILGIFFIILSILIMSILAAIRNDDVGKDISAYVMPQFEWAKLFDFDKYITIGNVEYGFKVFVYVVTMLFGDYHWILFFLQLIVCTNIYIFAYRQRNDLSMSMVILIYLMLCYNDTLTMMRQYVALSFILLSIMFLLEKKYLKTLILFFIAVLFHTTAMVSIIIYILILMNKSNKITESSKKYLNILAIALFLVCLIFYRQIIYFLSYKLPILPTKFYAYFTSSYYLEESNISNFMLIFKLGCIFVEFIFMKFYKKSDKFFLILLLIDFGIYLISAKLTTISRLGYYFYYPSILYVMPQLKKILKKDRYNLISINLIFVVVLCVYWYYNFVLYNGGGTMPYASDILNNLV